MNWRQKSGGKKTNTDVVRGEAGGGGMRNRSWLSYATARFTKRNKQRRTTTLLVH